MYVCMFIDCNFSIAKSYMIIPIGKIPIETF